MDTEKALLITSDFQDDYGRIIARIVQIENGFKIRNMSDEHEDLADFEVSALIDKRAYSWVYCYKPYVVTLDRAKHIVKVLRRVDKGLKRLTDIRGPAQNFAQYVLRIAEILKIKTFVWKIKGNSIFYSENVYHITGSISEVIYKIQNMEHELTEKLQ